MSTCNKGLNAVKSMFKRHFKSLHYFYIVSRQEETRFKKQKNHLNLERNSSIVSFTKVI